jgi:hypothetical protein
MFYSKIVFLQRFEFKSHPHEKSVCKNKNVKFMLCTVSQDIILDRSTFSSQWKWVMWNRL